MLDGLLATTEQMIQISWDQMTWFIGGALTVLATAVAGVWKMMEGQVKHWKELHEAKERDLVAVRKENEEIKKNPTDVAVRYVTMAEALLSSQIAKLEEAVHTLKADCASKEAELQKVTKVAAENEERFVYAQDAKESLERKIAVYEEILQRLMLRKNLSEEVISSFRSQAFDVGHIEAETQSEINERIREIDRTSFGRYSQANRQAVQTKRAAAEITANQQMKQKLADLKDAEEKAEGRMKAKTQLSLEGTESRTHTPDKS
ncbi:hypothetical protein CU048_01910 [Beijerinckiaceae bacterium]|nr:hypothetical protein CU048_01910 [Beijerinckiaceae bacterium]